MAADTICAACGEQHDAEGPSVIVTVRVADLPEPVRGAVQKTCAVCAVAVWIAPSTFAFFVGRPLPPIWCGQCALLLASRGGNA